MSFVAGISGNVFVPFPSNTVFVALTVYLAPSGITEPASLFISGADALSSNDWSPILISPVEFSAFLFVSKRPCVVDLTAVLI